MRKRTGRQVRDFDRGEKLRLTLLMAFTLLCFLAALAVPCLLAAAPPERAPPPLVAELQRMVDVDGAPGVAVRVYRNGRLLYTASAGEDFTEAAVPVASASKWVAAALILTLVDDGLLSLDEPIGRRLPEMHGEAAGVTLRQLLSYTSGHEGLTAGVDIRQPPDITLRERARQIAARPLAARPGEEFRYGGPGLQIAGALAEQATGQSWAELFQRRLAQPLGMTRSHWPHLRARPGAAEPVRNPNLQAGLVTTAEDYGRFLTMLAQDGRYGGRRVLSSASIQAMSEPQTLGLRKAYTPAGVTGSLQYDLGNWCEDTQPGPSCRLMSSPGALGTYPWLDLNSGLYGVFITRIRLPRIAPRIQAARRIIETEAARSAP